MVKSAPLLSLPPVHTSVIKMSMRTRALVFSTFFGSCLAIGLLLVSLTTNHWVRATPRRDASTQAKGEVNFGLFTGNHHLNLGFGVRSTQFDGEHPKHSI